ncbi:hydrogenase maturation peptidase HycI [Methanocaldococcus sp.]
MDLYEKLKCWLNGCKKLAIIGLGNELKGDDAVGVYILKKFIKEKEYLIKNNILFINAQTVPDFFLGIIKEFSPTHIIFIDCVLANKNPGEIILVDENSIKSYSYSTHTFPLEVIIKYIKKDSNAKVKIIGVEPKIIDFSPMSGEVREIGDYIYKVLSKLIGD